MNYETFIFQSARILAKLACWGKIRMTHAEVLSYFEWLKARLSAVVRCIHHPLFFSQFFKQLHSRSGRSALFLMLLN